MDSRRRLKVFVEDMILESVIRFGENFCSHIWISAFLESEEHSWSSAVGEGSLDLDFFLTKDFGKNQWFSLVFMTDFCRIVS